LKALFQDISRIYISSASRDAAIDALDKFSLYGALSRLGVDTQASSALDAGLGYALTLYGVKGGAVEEGSARVGNHRREDT